MNPFQLQQQLQHIDTLLSTVESEIIAKNKDDFDAQESWVRVIQTFEYFLNNTLGDNRDLHSTFSAEIASYSQQKVDEVLLQSYIERFFVCSTFLFQQFIELHQTIQIQIGSSISMISEHSESIIKLNKHLYMHNSYEQSTSEFQMTSSTQASVNRHFASYFEYSLLKYFEILVGLYLPPFSSLLLSLQMNTPAIVMFHLNRCLSENSIMLCSNETIRKTILKMVHLMLNSSSNQSRQMMIFDDTEAIWGFIEFSWNAPFRLERLEEIAVICSIFKIINQLKDIKGNLLIARILFHSLEQWVKDFFEQKKSLNKKKLGKHHLSIICSLLELIKDAILNIEEIIASVNILPFEMLISSLCNSINTIGMSSNSVLVLMCECISEWLKYQASIHASKLVVLDLNAPALIVEILILKSFDHEIETRLLRLLIDMASVADKFDIGRSYFVKFGSTASYCIRLIENIFPLNEEEVINRSETCNLLLAFEFLRVYGQFQIASKIQISSFVEIINSRFDICFNESKNDFSLIRLMLQAYSSLIYGRNKEAWLSSSYGNQAKGIFTKLVVFITNQISASNSNNIDASNDEVEIFTFIASFTSDAIHSNCIPDHYEWVKNMFLSLRHWWKVRFHQYCMMPLDLLYLYQALLIQIDGNSPSSMLLNMVHDITVTLLHDNFLDDLFCCLEQGHDNDVDEIRSICKKTIASFVITCVFGFTEYRQKHLSELYIILTDESAIFPSTLKGHLDNIHYHIESQYTDFKLIKSVPLSLSLSIVIVSELSTPGKNFDFIVDMQNARDYDETRLQLMVQILQNMCTVDLMGLSNIFLVVLGFALFDSDHRNQYVVEEFLIRLFSNSEIGYELISMICRVLLSFYSPDIQRTMFSLIPFNKMDEQNFMLIVDSIINYMGHEKFIKSDIIDQCKVISVIRRFPSHSITSKFLQTYLSSLFNLNDEDAEELLKVICQQLLIEELAKDLIRWKVLNRIIDHYPEIISDVWEIQMLIKSVCPQYLQKFILQSQINENDDLFCQLLGKYSLSITASFSYLTNEDISQIYQVQEETISLIIHILQNHLPNLHRWLGIYCFLLGAVQFKSWETSINEKLSGLFVNALKQNHEGIICTSLRGIALHIIRMKSSSGYIQILDQQLLLELCTDNNSSILQRRNAILVFGIMLRYEYNWMKSMQPGVEPWILYLIKKQVLGEIINNQIEAKLLLVCLMHRTILFNTQYCESIPEYAFGHAPSDLERSFETIVSYLKQIQMKSLLDIALIILIRKNRICSKQNASLLDKMMSEIATCNTNNQVFSGLCQLWANGDDSNKTIESLLESII